MSEAIIYVFEKDDSPTQQPNASKNVRRFRVEHTIKGDFQSEFKKFVEDWKRKNPERIAQLRKQIFDHDPDHFHFFGFQESEVLIPASTILREIKPDGTRFINITEITHVAVFLEVDLD